MTMQKQSPLLIVLFKSARLLFPLAVLLCIVSSSLFSDVLTPTMQLVGLGVVIILFGLPHGALDPWIAQKIGFRDSLTKIIVFTTGYLAIAVLVVLIWLWLPALSLSIFLLISIWHFSDDWVKSLNMPLRLCAGLLLLLMPIGFHTEAVHTIFQQLSGPTGGSLALILALPSGLLITAMLMTTACAVWKRQWRCSLELISLLCLAYFVDPLIYFTVYFCLLHSPHHLSGLLISAPITEHSRLAWMMLIYTIATLVLLGGLWWLWSSLPTDTLILKLIFIGLAAVTVPHMMLVGAARRHQADRSCQKAC